MDINVDRSRKYLGFTCERASSSLLTAATRPALPSSGDGLPLRHAGDQPQGGHGRVTPRDLVTHGG